MLPVNWITLLKWLIPFCLVMFLLGFVYSKGYHKRDNEVAQLHLEVKKWKDGFEAQEKTLSNERAAHETALKGLKTDQAAVVADLKGQLDEALKKAGKTHVVIQHEIQYITPAVDAAFPLPNIFVRVHDDALREDGAPQAATVAERGRADDAAPSGVAISEAARVIASNYAECTARDAVITAWQDWYTKNKAAWEKATKAQSNFDVVRP
jgi:hypothetical protein